MGLLSNPRIGKRPVVRHRRAVRIDTPYCFAVAKSDCPRFPPSRETWTAFALLVLGFISCPQKRPTRRTVETAQDNAAGRPGGFALISCVWSVSVGMLSVSCRRFHAPCLATPQLYARGARLVNGFFTVRFMLSPFISTGRLPTGVLRFPGLSRTLPTPSCPCGRPPSPACGGRRQPKAKRRGAWRP